MLLAMYPFLCSNTSKLNPLYPNKKNEPFRRVLRNDIICFIEGVYNMFITAFNRNLPVVIAFHRYIYVFHWSWVYGDAIYTFYRLSRFHWVRLMNWFNAGLFIVVVPFVYIRIFIWRKNHKESGISEIQRQKRKRSNVVSMWYNMVIWAAELISLVLAVILYILYIIYIIYYILYVIYYILYIVYYIS